VLIYVHGFNQTFESSALDAARLSDGIRFRGETMVFSWPSRAKLFDYSYDRDSAIWSRDALQTVLDGLIRRSPSTPGNRHVETGLAGWACKTRTQKRRGKIAL
jgi:esterase/lipase superfamily enzyme